jgi:hypothetical protein
MTNGCKEVTMLINIYRYFCILEKYWKSREDEYKYCQASLMLAHVQTLLFHQL